MLADGRRVKPVAGLHVDQRFERFPTIFCPLLLPDLPDAFDITLHKVGGIRFAAVGDHLDRGDIVRSRHLLGKIHWDHHQTANAPGLHFLNQFLAIIADGGVNIRRTGHGMGKIQRLFTLLFEQNPYPQLAGVEVDPIAEDKQQQQRDHHSNQPTAGIADDLARLFHAQRADATPGESGVTHAYAPYPSH